MNYQDFLESKRHRASQYGIDPLFIPEQMFDFQKFVTDEKEGGLDF